MSLSDSVKIADELEIARVWSGHPVGFSLLTNNKWQFVAFYDEKRQMTVASRQLNEREWSHYKLPSHVGWDSHNGITMTTDNKEFLHLSGNMHCDPLVYFRSDRPNQIDTLRGIHQMVGGLEDKCTYPRFFKGAQGELIFKYRHGRSGKGCRLCNVYDIKMKKWRRLLDEPLFDGIGDWRTMNAYPYGPVRGPEGWFHIVWMWRYTGSCATNHNISYIRSPNFIDWENAAGNPLKLPVNPGTEGVIVDPVPPGEGLINMGFGIGFDLENRPVVTYHKYDKQRNSQIYNARWIDNHWQINQASKWNIRWDFGGGGSVPCKVRAGVVRKGKGNTLWQTYYHWKLGTGVWELDPETLSPCQELSMEDKELDSILTSMSDVFYFEDIKELFSVESDHPKMNIRITKDSDQSYNNDSGYVLKWETLPVNRDRPHPDPIPKPSILRLYKLSLQ